MILEDRECESLITQLVAIRSAVENVGALVLNNHMKLCFRRERDFDSDVLSSLARVVSIWGRVRVGDGT